MASKRSKPAWNETGFTLLEVIIAIAIMVLAFTAILSTQSNSINATAITKQLNIVGMLAKTKMVDTEYSLEGKTFEEVKKEEGGQFEAPYQDYRWMTIVKEIEFPELKVASSGGSSTGASGGTDVTEMLTKLLTNFLSKAVREVTVSVYWNQAGSERKFSLTTYWVDLNHEFALSE